jgi:hypothetical protein
MLRPAVVLLVALAPALACDRSRAGMPPELADAVRAEVGPLLVGAMRAPVGTPAEGDGDAGDDYAIARLSLASLPPELDERARLRHGRFGEGEPLPAALVAALAHPAVTTIVEAVERGAARRFVTSPFALPRSVDERPADFLAIADLVVLTARERAEHDDPRAALDRLAALVRLGHDLARQADLAGLEVGAKIERNARRVAAEIAARAFDGAAATAALAPPADPPAPGDALIDLARNRLGLAALAAGIPLGLARWSGRSAAQALTPWTGADGDPIDAARRTLAELAAYRGLPPGADEAAVRAACESAWRAGFAPCAELARRHAEVVAALAATRGTQK